MDPISHAVVGAAIAAMAPEASPAIFLATVAGAVSPDCDIVVRRVAGPGAYLQYHRGPSHSPGALALLGLVITGLVRLLLPTGLGYWPLFGWTALGLLSHVLLDCTNNYGTQALWPFNAKRIHWDLTFIVDVQLFVLIGAGALLAWAWPGHRAGVFRAVVAVCVLYMLARWAVHSRVLRAVRRRYAGADQALVQPGALGINRWRYVVRHGRRWSAGAATAWPLWLDEPWVVESDAGLAVEAARRAKSAGYFLSWSTLTRVAVSQQDDGYAVRFTDMRFDWPGISIFGTTVWLDSALNVTSDKLQAGGAPSASDRGALLREMLGRRRPRQP